MSSVEASRWHIIEGQPVDLTSFNPPGLVLDIGGGGEGIIGRLLGNRVVAIDLRLSELEEAPPGPLKIVMDARELKFTERSFDTATAFFSFLYIEAEHHETVLREVNRVLKPEGRFHVWDAEVPSEPLPGKEALLVEPEIRLPGHNVKPGYGVPWRNRHQDLDWFARLGGRVGFRVEQTERLGSIFRIMIMRLTHHA